MICYPNILENSIKLVTRRIIYQIVANFMENPKINVSQFNFVELNSILVCFWKQTFNLLFKGSMLGHKLHINTLQSNNLRLQRFLNKVFWLPKLFSTLPHILLGYFPFPVMTATIIDLL